MKCSFSSGIFKILTLDACPFNFLTIDVKPDIFKHMIYYTYGGKLSEDELKNNAKDIINACDKYGVVL